MERSEFLSKMGLGLVVVCTGCSLVSCGSGSKNNDPQPQSQSPQQSPSPGGGSLLSADLNSELLNIGDSKLNGGVIVVRLAAANVAASFTAVQSACTHQGTTIAYHNDQGLFICPLHGSEFSKTGAVIQGPAALALHQYTIVITNNALTVS